MIFLADENLMVQAVRLLEAFDQENEIRHLTAHFDRGTPDMEWIRSVGSWSPKSTIVGGDGRILRNRAERRTLRSADLSFVYLAPGWTNLPWDTFAWKIIKAWPGVVRNISSARNPTVFEVKPGQLKVEKITVTANI